MVEAMVVPSIDNLVVLKAENSVFSTTEVSIDGANVASKLNFCTNYEKKLIRRNHL